MEQTVFVEENGVYQIDCSAAVWATDQIYSCYHSAGTFLSDADFAIETSDFLLLIEYKNAGIPGAANPQAFNPASEKGVKKVARKFYDSLHYLSLEEKSKPVRYVYIVEYPNAGETDRKNLRNLIGVYLPFRMQCGKSKKIIEDFEVLSISEWNSHAEYGAFQITPVISGDAEPKRTMIQPTPIY